MLVFATVKLVLSNLPPDRADAIARTLIEEHLAACINLLPIRSVYRWKGAIERGDEVPLVLKTRADLFDEIALAVKRLHPYEMPSIVATELPLVERDYADWLADETKEASQTQ